MKKLVFLLILGSTLAGCKTVKPSGNTGLLELNGKIEKLGMSTFQYGTHLLKTGTKTYALKSTNVDLDVYVEKQVTIKGSKEEGYPVENGPDLIDVKEVAIK